MRDLKGLLVIFVGLIVAIGVRAQTVIFSEDFDPGTLSPGWMWQGFAPVLVSPGANGSGYCVGKESWDQSGPYSSGPGPLMFHQLPYDPNATYTINASLRVSGTGVANCAVGWWSGSYFNFAGDPSSSSTTWMNMQGEPIQPAPDIPTPDMLFGIVLVMNPSATTATAFFDNVVVTASNFTPPSSIALQLKAWLGGPFVQAQNLMRDDLRAGGLVPLIDPYGSGTATTASVLGVTGNNAIVDWVSVELRLIPTQSVPIAATSALIQRDGDIVAADGVSPVTFTVAPEYYHVVVRHRTHLPIMTANAYPLISNPTSLDLRTNSVPMYVRSAPFTDLPRKAVGTVQVMWSGNVVSDDRLKYFGTLNDRDAILTAIGGTFPTNTISGYHAEDVTMDGVVKYTGANNDRDPILQNIGGTVPTNVRISQVP